jgi:hypothetical protein
MQSALKDCYNAAKYAKYVSLQYYYKIWLWLQQNCTKKLVTLKAKFYKMVMLSVKFYILVMLIAKFYKMVMLSAKFYIVVMLSDKSCKYQLSNITDLYFDLVMFTSYIAQISNKKFKVIMHRVIPFKMLMFMYLTSSWMCITCCSIAKPKIH